MLFISATHLPTHIPAYLINPMSATKFDKLTDDNYLAWFKWMCAYLVKQDAWGIVSGAEAKPLRSSRSKPMKAWTQKRDIVAAEILLHVSKKYIAHCDDEDPAGTWEHLQILFHAQGQSTIATLHCEFHSVMKTGDESMRCRRKNWLVHELTKLRSYDDTTNEL